MATKKSKVEELIKGGKSNIEINEITGYKPDYIRKIRSWFNREQRKNQPTTTPQKTGKKKKIKDPIKEIPETQEAAAKLAIKILGGQVDVIRGQIADIDEKISIELDQNNSLSAKNYVTSKAILFDKIITACDKIGKLSKLYGKKKDIRPVFQPEVIDD